MPIPRTIKGYLEWDWTNERPMLEEEHKATVFVCLDGVDDVEEYMEEEGLNGLPVEIIITEEGVKQIEENFKAMQDQEKKIENWMTEISKAKEIIGTTKKLLSGELQKELSTPDYKEVTQGEFNEKMKELC